MPSVNLLRMPDGLSFEDAAALPIAYGTAYRMMVERAKVKAGERVLILGATGGVGICAVDLAKAAGCEVNTAQCAFARLTNTAGSATSVNNYCFYHFYPSFTG